MNAIRNQKLYAELSDLERRGLKILAAKDDVSMQRLIGRVLRDYLQLQGQPVEGSVKA